MNKMIVIFIFYIFISFTIANPVKPVRRFFKEECDAAHVKYLIVEKSPGLYDVEDLSPRLLLKKTEVDDVTYFFYSKENPIIPVILKNGKEDKLHISKFNPLKETIFIIHGWNNDHSSPVNTLILDALLGKYDMNIFVVDWRVPANSNYFTASSAVLEIGKYVGAFINALISKHGLVPSSLILCGHSLGAHVAGNAGAVVNGTVELIIGMDPASPLFSLDNTENRLDETDASFVHVIHTNGDLLGFKSSIGHADYFPNGGARQPGCTLDIAGICSHSRSYQYFAESIKGDLFPARQCTSLEDFVRGRCDSRESSYMGGYEVDMRANGDFFLETNEKEPFAKG